MHEAQRRKAVWAHPATAEFDALLITHGPDVRYVTGFTGSSAAVALTRRSAVLFTDGRYTTQAREETERVRVVIGKGAPAGLAAAYLAGKGAVRCGFDAGHTSVAALATMRKALPAGVRRSLLVPTENVIASLREIKDADERARMQRAADLGCELFAGVLERISAGVPEIEVAAHLEFAARLGGAEAMSFDTIVASGARSALPHGRATGATLPRRGFVTLDFGVLVEGYCSDMTRTVHVGKANPRERAVYDSVLEAQQAAVAAVRPGVLCREVDEAARAVLRRAGLGKAFAHSTGHGVGLEIHEGPRLAATSEERLQPGMVITIEPGAYLPGEFGVRIEDMVLVTESGHEVMTAASAKDWTQL